MFVYMLRTRTRNARTRANANVIQALRLVVTRRDGRTIRTSSKMFLPSVFFCGLTYVYRKRALQAIKMFKEQYKIHAKQFAKNDIRKIVK